MQKTVDNIRNSIQKRQKALDKFMAMKRNFFLSKARITKDISEARTIWEKTLEQLPNLPFN